MQLSEKERELVSIGAALGSNCVPCIEYHIPAALKAGLSEIQIREAILIANTVKMAPAEKVLSVAMSLIGPKDDSAPAPACSCGNCG